MIGKIGAAFVLGGLAGWALENALTPTNQPARYSRAFLGYRVPFLPVYGAGAAAITLGAPVLAPLAWPVRAGAYAAGLAALELAACRMDRDLAAKRLPKAAPTPALPSRTESTKPAWDYGDGPGVAGNGCVDVPHAIAWAGLGLVAERLVR